MRLITPELAKFHFPSFRFDPPEVPRKKKPDEDPPPDVAPDEPLGPDPEAPQDPQDPSDPQYEYTAGDYIDITDRKVSLKHNDVRRHCVFPTNLNVLIRECIAGKPVAQMSIGFFHPAGKT